jgi:hypothetical protein
MLLGAGEFVLAAAARAAETLRVSGVKVSHQSSRKGGTHAKALTLTMIVSLISGMRS